MRAGRPYDSRRDGGATQESDVAPPKPRPLSLLLYQRLQRFHVSAVVARTVNGCFCDECGGRGARIIEEAPKRLAANLSLAYVLVAIELRTPLALGVVAMPDADVFQTDGFVEMAHGCAHSFGAHNVVPRNMSVAGINAGADR